MNLYVELITSIPASPHGRQCRCYIGYIFSLVSATYKVQNVILCFRSVILVKTLCSLFISIMLGGKIAYG